MTDPGFAHNNTDKMTKSNKAPSSPPYRKSKSGVSVASPASYVDKVLSELAALYPDPRPHLMATSPWELLVATVLSAQCTDERVNKVTPELFRRWKGPEAMADASIAELEECIHSVGLFHSKAKNLKACAAMLVTEFKGELPRTLEQLIKLPGVGRKTANVVLWGAYGLNCGLAVDTHVARISLRLGFTSGKEPEKAERELMKLLPQAEWGNYNHRMVSFGRDVCKARSPECKTCVMSAWCPQLGV